MHWFLDSFPDQYNEDIEPDDCYGHFQPQTCIKFLPRNLGDKTKVENSLSGSLNIKAEADKQAGDKSNKLDIFLQTNYIHNIVIAFFLYCYEQAVEAKMK